MQADTSWQKTYNANRIPTCTLVYWSNVVPLRQTTTPAIDQKYRNIYEYYGTGLGCKYRTIRAPTSIVRVSYINCLNDFSLQEVILLTYLDNYWPLVLAINFRSTVSLRRLVFYVIYIYYLFG